MNKKVVKLNFGDVEELVCHILEYDHEETDCHFLDSELFDKWDIGIDTFKEILEKLLPLIDVGKSPLTLKRYKGFSDQKGNFFVKMEIEKEHA